MKRFIQGEHRGQSTLLPGSLDDYVSDTKPADTGRPAYHPEVLLKIYIYGYLNRIRRAHTWTEKLNATLSSCG